MTPVWTVAAGFGLIITAGILAAATSDTLEAHGEALEAAGRRFTRQLAATARRAGLKVRG